MDEHQFDVLYQEQWAPLVRQVTMVCGDQVEAADCVQEAFVRAWENRRRLEADAGGWVRTTALRVAVSRWRRARNALTAWTRDSGGRDPAGWLVPGHEHDAPVWRALAALPHAQREALVMRYVLDLPVAEVADVLGVPAGTVGARLSRGRAAAAAALGGLDGAPAPGPSAPRPDDLGAVPLRTERLT